MSFGGGPKRGRAGIRINTALNLQLTHGLTGCRLLEMIFSMLQSAQQNKTTRWLILLAGFMTLLVASAEPADLIARWSGEGNGRDSMGKNNGVLTDITYVKEKTGQAFVFNGKSSQMKISASREFGVGLTNGFTLEAWINPSDVSNSRAIFEWNNGVDSWGVHLNISPGMPFNTHPGSGELFANLVDNKGVWHELSSSGNVVVSNAFQYVALTYDRKSGDAKIYCNGVVVADRNLGNFEPQTSYDLYLGRLPLTHGETFAFKGGMDEIAIYNHALSDEQINANYRRRQ
jgi:hypothetical protein